MALLRSVIFIFAYTLTSFNLGYSSWSVIRDSEDWKIYSSDIVNPEVESYVLNNIDNIKYDETGIDFRCYPRIKYRYRLENMPDIMIYSLFSCGSFPYGDENYNWVIFNYNDSSLYHFGGDLRSFNAVFSDYLKNNYHNKKIVKLLWLYFNTLDNDQITYHIINDIDDFENLYNLYKIQDPEIKKEAEIAIVNKVIEPVRIQSLEYEEFGINLSKIRLYTWKWPSGIIEEWFLFISKDRITIANNSELLKQIGPRLID